MSAETHDPPANVPAPMPPAPLSDAPAQPALKALSAEEQMALFEKELKENDWGHQPC